MLGLLFGLIAWLIPILTLTNTNWVKIWFGKSWQALTVLLSMTSCVMAIWFEMHFQYKLMMRHDYSAMQDVFPTAVNAALFLFITTVLANVFMLYRTRNLQ